MSIFKRKHRHNWVLKYSLPGGYSVRECHDKKCGIIESRMWEFVKHEFQWIPGNYVTDSLRPIYVIAGNYDEFLQAQQDLTAGLNAVGHFNIIFVRGFEDLDGADPMPVIIFYGTWYTNGILEDPRITTILNHRR